jgi:trigger factor
LKIAREETPSCEVVLNIEVEEEDIKPYLSQAMRRLGGRVRIPGFRQGRAPAVMLQNVLGPELIREEAIDLLIGPTVQKALEQEKVEPFALPQVDLASHEPLVLKATTPVKPSVNLGDYKSIRVEPKTTPVEDKNVDEVISKLQYDSSPWEPAEREAKFGDLLNMDVDGWVEGRRVTQDKAVNYVLRQENTLPLKGFAVHLEGLKKDGEKEFTLNVPEDYPDKSMVGKECRFKVKVLEVKEKKLKALDDEFARSLSESFESLAALRDKVRADLQEHMDRDERQRVEKEAASQLVKQAIVQFSPLLVEREVDRQMERREQLLKQNRVDMDSYLAQIGKSQEEIREELRKGTREELTQSLVLGKLAEEEKLTIESGEMEGELETMVSRAGNDAASVRDMFSSAEGRRSLSNMLLTRKVMERLWQYAAGKNVGTAPPADEVQQQESEQTKIEPEGGKADGNAA